MIYVDAAWKVKIEATAKLRAYVETEGRAKQMQREQVAEDVKSKGGKWGVPIAKVEQRSS